MRRDGPQINLYRHLLGWSGVTLPGVERDAGEGVKRGFEVELPCVEIVEGLCDEGVEQRGRVATLRRCRLP